MNDISKSDPVLNAILQSESELSDVLVQICARTRAETEQKAKIKPLKEIAEEAKSKKTPTRGFARVLKEKMAKGQMGLIAECKKASPSAGVIRQEYDPAMIAVQYENAGASCLSVLTETGYFYGNNEDLKIARDACSLPVLRKDFILEPWQVYESRVIDADCILLILAALKDQEASELVELAKCLELDVLVEVHNEEELNRALALDVCLIGINNRNLRTLQTDIAVTEALSPLVPPDRIIVSESGLKTFDDIRRVQAVGASAVLVGESLLSQQNAGAAVRNLLGLV
ncbi:Indole-3-glycerol phosphate synthase (TrpC) (PDB:6BMA) [Commensalibacter communis]|uniref:Indole-3-glycerol phosphate synthase n=1 Tax=Commensalibacter communis TaxID=2972786 RepID=A0A9W4X6F5_9PROT|nr:indole-3-glycerol phosphate synthase TrpC [Commensalibacter communis]CAI3922973.1 Indole-3-glycerol phosphate synthase (TrpC) (PDB:6BMA) [Commensalibacter communis]CAI3926930.1 Indole-3-glycerol phosphate synthase (TrpC) (PDB:6BMA) [Commensalibacter communis]CAI3927536.1 Indole-3-glycerol phosphate synthase (TrpC) (PDB:6BMA) [Commensalibacter communis]CAI3933916.1 Indole-3-glycerol phosphate synthase (TrpC) (PDB:6BMA) [Commensalibacter communis]CAI3935234.1 Indole-3-glycerol phosphate synth